jgi:hypothetical protein
MPGAPCAAQALCSACIMLGVEQARPCMSIKQLAHVVIYLLHKKKGRSHNHTAQPIQPLQVYQSYALRVQQLLPAAALCTRGQMAQHTWHPKSTWFALSSAPAPRHQPAHAYKAPASTPNHASRLKSTACTLAACWRVHTHVLITHTLFQHTSHLIAAAGRGTDQLYGCPSHNRSSW